jgi:DNA-binding transcriptional ArsR family regulator
VGITRTENFPEVLNRQALLLKALGHPARLAIVTHLLKEQQCICTNLVDELGLAQATVSQHLKALKEAGIIKGTIEGRSICYCLDQHVWNELAAIFTELNTYKINGNQSNCC